MKKKNSTKHIFVLKEFSCPIIPLKLNGKPQRTLTRSPYLAAGYTVSWRIVIFGILNAQKEGLVCYSPRRKIWQSSKDEARLIGSALRVTLTFTYNVRRMVWFGMDSLLSMPHSLKCANLKQWMTSVVTSYWSKGWKFEKKKLLC